MRGRKKKSAKRGQEKSQEKRRKMWVCGGEKDLVSRAGGGIRKTAASGPEDSIVERDANLT